MSYGHISKYSFKKGFLRTIFKGLALREQIWKADLIGAEFLGQFFEQICWGRFVWKEFCGRILGLFVEAYSSF